MTLDGDVTAVPPDRDRTPPWAAFHCYGSHGLLMYLQGREDLVGALGADQMELARHAARDFAQITLGLLARRHEGDPEDEGDLMANPFAGVDAEDIATDIDGERAVIRAADVPVARAAVAAVDDVIADLVRDLGFTEAPPAIRTPAGPFTAPRMTRRMLSVNKAANLPLVFPDSWISEPKPAEGER